MEFETIVRDAISDFNKEENGIISEPVQSILLHGITEAMRSAARENSPEDNYGLVMYFVYYFLNEVGDFQGVDETDLENAMKRYLSVPMERHLERIELFKWVPESLKRVFDDSHKIFEMAKDAYFMDDCEEDEAKEAQTLLDNIFKARDVLDSETCVYRDKRDVTRLYEDELSESQLDVDTIMGERLFFSFRLSDYIRSMEGLGDMEPDFTTESPFAVDDKLFDI